jgi:Txe/YoeB family toxin of Txe-Axe toxin-antitoxin module
MNIDFLTKDQKKYLSDHNLVKKFEKQYQQFLKNPYHPSLNLEILEPKNKGFYSFKLDRKYRVIFIFNLDQSIEILSITNHYH